MVTRCAKVAQSLLRSCTSANRLCLSLAIWRDQVDYLAASGNETFRSCSFLIVTRDFLTDCREWLTWLEEIKWLFKFRLSLLFRAYCSSFHIHYLLLTFFPFIFNCLISILLFPCASVRENIRAWVPRFLLPYWMELALSNINTLKTWGYMGQSRSLNNTRHKKKIVARVTQLLEFKIFFNFPWDQVFIFFCVTVITYFSFSNKF